MFLFTSLDSTLDLARVQAGFEEMGSVRYHRTGTGALLWLNDSFTHVSIDSCGAVIELRRPGVDETPVCRFEWTFASTSIRLHRRWSGEFAVHYCEQPRMITSHLRAAALAFRGLPRAVVPLKPGWTLDTGGRNGARLVVRRETRLRAPFRRTRQEAVRAVRALLCESVASQPDPITLLLSGGIDSSAVAAAAVLSGRRVRAVMFSLAYPMRPQAPWESDAWNARVVANHLRLPLTELLLDHRTVIKGVPLALQLAETARGTIVDECAALVAVAKRLRALKVKRVCIAESADDLFGGFKFPLRLFKGRALTRYYRRQLEVDLPDELAILQKIFGAFGISIVDPFWTTQLVDVGYNLPLRYRVDRQRKMKRILRDAFADVLPPEIVQRPKCVTRDATQIRYALERRYGTSRERYRLLLRTFLEARWQW
jgi:asparagine synthetase B (glutamine-hydrolysing)